MKNQQSSFKLYTHPHSANGCKALAVSYFLQLKPEIILVNVYQGEGQALDYLITNLHHCWAFRPNLRHFSASRIINNLFSLKSILNTSSCRIEVLREV